MVVNKKNMEKNKIQIDFILNPLLKDRAEDRGTRKSDVSAQLVLIPAGQEAN